MGALANAAFNVAWYAANKESGEGGIETHLDDFKKSMATAKTLAPADWPLHDVETMFKYGALAAASHRSADMRLRKQKKKDEFHHAMYVEPESRDDWHIYHENAKKLKGELGTDQT